jgi:UDP-N-acetylmuramoyl-tripeptide--D-alanyl-D-alanine ligase
MPMGRARFTMREVLAATGGTLRAGRRELAPTEKGTIAGISIDTRTIRKGELYVAIIGKRLDGHDFVAEAIRKGAAGVLVSQDLPKSARRKIGPAIKVRDTTRALGDIAAFHRRRFNPIVIAVTGSNGKSTTKEMLAAILAQRFRVLKPESSFNNDIGVPLTVLAMNQQTQAAIIEMEMNLLGGTRRLCEIAQPQIGVVTNIGDTHLEFLRDREGVAQEKSELIEYIGGRGASVLNADDPLVMEIGRRFPTRERVTFGIRRPADVFATRIRNLGEKGLSFLLNGAVPVRLPIIGRHNVANALAAVAAAGAVGVHTREAVAGIEGVKPLPLRLQIERFGGLTLIADCYNANPQSMAAALEVLRNAECRMPNRKGGRKIAVLGEMLELGDRAARPHYELGLAAGSVADWALVKGEHAADVIRGARQAGIAAGRALAVRDAAQAVQKLIDIARPKDTILVKGSRANRLEEIVQEFRKRMS